MRLVYVAGPLRSPSRWQYQKNVQAAECVGHELMGLGFAPVIPHKNYENFGEEMSAAVLAAELRIISGCDLVLVLNGWERSRGTQLEMSFCFAKQIPVFFEAETHGHPTTINPVLADEDEAIDRLLCERVRQQPWHLVGSVLGDLPQRVKENLDGNTLSTDFIRNYDKPATIPRAA